MRQLSVKNPFGAPVYHEETVSSTMETARILAGQNEGHGTVITADFQEGGRGRLKRPWSTERGKNLLFTILLRYGALSSIPEALTLRTGLAVSQAIEDFAPALSGSVQVKWPNDVMIYPQGEFSVSIPRKAVGILTETDGKNVFIGVGVNVAQEEFPEEYRSKAISIIQAVPVSGAPGMPGKSDKSGKPGSFDKDARFDLLEKILFRLYNEIEKGEEASVATPLRAAGSWQERLIRRLYKKGELVTFAEGAADSNQITEGILSGIGPGGELLIIPRGENKERAFVNGELRVY